MFPRLFFHGIKKFFFNDIIDIFAFPNIVKLLSCSESFESHRGFYRLHWVDPIHTSKKFVKENSFPGNDRINRILKNSCFSSDCCLPFGVKRPS